MSPFVFLSILLSFANSCFALEYYYFTSVQLEWNVTNSVNYVLSNGRTYFPTGLGFLGSEVSTNATIKYRLVLLSDGGNRQFQLSVVAWDEGMDDIVDVIWQANNNKTVGMNSTLKLQHDGNLVLRNSENEPAWESNTADIGVMEMFLTDYGALELKNETNYTVWSSFKHPTNKMVCAQVLVQGLALTNGDYRFSSEATGAALYYQQQPYQIWNISGLTAPTCYVVFCCDINGATLQLRSNTTSISLYRNYLKSNWDDCSASDAISLINLQINSGDISYVAVATLGADGVLTAEKLSVKNSAFQGNDSCNLPNICGPYGLCATNNSCTCPLDPSYFKPIDPSDTASGCELSNGYGQTGKCHMKYQSGIDYFENQFVQPDYYSETEDKCSNFCLENPNCTVAFYRTASKSCFLVTKVSSLRANGSAGYSASFKVCKKGSSRVTVIGAAAGGSCLALLIIVLLIYLKMRKGDEGEEDDGIANSCLSESTLKRFSLRELGQLTSEFSEKLGEGAFGIVYKGLLTNGTSIAVKCLNGSTKQSKDFCAELSILSRARHYNLVQLVGFCSNKKSRALVYEYLSNGSLDQWLMGKKSFQLKWEIRMEIAIGAAKGIRYLHEGCPERVLHLDVKPQNILLDEQFCPKVADFGLSKLMGREENAVFMTTICGTPGYVAPEVVRGEGIDVKTDVYSFGVVLIEIFAGRKPLEPRPEQIWNLSKDDEAMRSSADRRLGGSFNLEEARRMLRVAALCINLDPEPRPHMSAVVQMLEGEKDIPQLVPTLQFYPNISDEANLKFMRLLESRPSSSYRLPSASTPSPMAFVRPR